MREPLIFADICLKLDTGGIVLYTDFNKNPNSLLCSLARNRPCSSRSLR